MLQKGGLTSTSKQSRSAQTRYNPTAPVHLPVKSGHQPCSAAYGRARWRREARKLASDTATEHDEAAWSSSRKPTPRPPDCSAKCRRVAWESARRRPARSRPRRPRGAILQDGLYLEHNASPRRMLVLVEKKMLPGPRPAGPERGAAPAPSAPTTVLGTTREAGELETRPGAGSALYA